MSTELVPSHLMVPAGTGSLDAYIQEVNKVPILTLEEEQVLARRYLEEEDLEAARRMVLAHLRFVVHVAKGYTGYGLALGDLIQEGNIGLMKAVKRFDPDHGVRLVSFAVHWIRAEMHEFILRNWRIVKVATTKAQRKLFFNLRKSKKRLGWLSSDEVNKVAKDLGVKPEVVLEMESRLSGQDIGFDLSSDNDDESAYVAWKANWQIRTRKQSRMIIVIITIPFCTLVWMSWMIAVVTLSVVAGCRKTTSQPCRNWLIDMVFQQSASGNWKLML